LNCRFVQDSTKTKTSPSSTAYHDSKAAPQREREENMTAAEPPRASYCGVGGAWNTRGSPKFRGQEEEGQLRTLARENKAGHF